MTRVLSCPWKLCGYNHDGYCTSDVVELEAETIEYKDEDRTTEEVLKCNTYKKKQVDYID